MKKGNKIIVTIIILLVLLLIAGVAFAYVYTATDIFRTDKEMFLTYFAQLTSEEDGFIDKRIGTYYEKKKQNAYENSGEITFENELPEDEATDAMEKVNDLAIRFSGKVDSVNQKVEQNIEIDYGNDVILPINYIQAGNAIGLQSDELAKKYIAVRNENLKQLATNLGLEDATDIPDEIDFSEATKDISISDAEIEQLKQIYFPILQENLLDENFTRNKTEQEETYTLELSNEQIKNIVIKMLETTKQNTLIIDKINEIMLAQNPEAEKIDESIIDDLINDIKGEKKSNNTSSIIDITQDITEGVNSKDIADIPNLKITLVQSDKKLNQIIIQSGVSTISIKKNNLTDGVDYNINCEIISEDEAEEAIIKPAQGSAFLNLQYEGLDTLATVKENYEFGFDPTKSGESVKYTYKINNDIEFNESISIDELDNSVAIFLNDYDETQLTPFLTQVGNRLLEINKNQMSELGLKENENPLLYSNPITSYLLLTLMVYDSAVESIENSNLSQYEIQMFNDKFVKYEGKDVSGVEVNALIATVQNNSLSSAGSEAHLVKVTLDGAETVTRVSISNSYNVEAIYDDDGYVVEMKVTTNN